jgi:hypothetical protein
MTACLALDRITHPARYLVVNRRFQSPCPQICRFNSWSFDFEFVAVRGKDKLYFPFELLSLLPCEADAERARKQPQDDTHGGPAHRRPTGGDRGGRERCPSRRQRRPCRRGVRACARSLPAVAVLASLTPRVRAGGASSCTARSRSWASARAPWRGLPSKIGESW